MAVSESEWMLRNEAPEREEALKTIKTVDIKMEKELQHASTEAIRNTIKSSEEVVEEMRVWLRTGITPDGTRMMTDENSQWYLDYYQVTAKSDKEHECIPENSLVDYYYWNAPYLAHIGGMNLVMMHSQVNLRDGTHLPSDRLRAQNIDKKTLQRLAEKQVEVDEREREEFLRKAVAADAHRGHPLRKEGFYTKYLWRPYHQRTLQSRVHAFEERARAEHVDHDKSTPTARLPTVVRQAKEHESSAPAVEQRDQVEHTKES